MAQLLIDTNIISNAYLPDPPEWIRRWLSSLPPGSLAVPWVVVYETEYGIRQVQRQNPLRALNLLDWFEGFLDQRLSMPEMTVEAARLLGAMAACRPLRNMFVTANFPTQNGAKIKNGRIKLGADAMLAAIAIAHRLPIATLNIKDFVYIDRYFPLPGLYDPKHDEWVVDPPIGWGMTDNANDDRSDWAPGARAVT
ncbi:type II toxin-antitoxin system VapC family toxin [Rhizobium ruizarguesonis]